MLAHTATRTVVATRDDQLVATVRHEQPLRYADGPDDDLDRPVHVRAGSGVAWAGERLVIVQDDANFLAVVSPHDGHCYGIPLPAGKDNRRQFDDGRRNKKHKLDLEAVASVRDAHGDLHIVALSSGSKRVRDTITVVRDLDCAAEQAPYAGHRVDLHRRPQWYDMLRGAQAFSGSELNIEGAVFLESTDGGVLRLLNRGNGKSRDGTPARNATADIAWADFAACLANEDHIPSLGNIVHHVLGELNGCPLGFTDACVVSTHGRETTLLFTAAAEASDDAVTDGDVLGCVIGVIAENSRDIEVRWTPLRNPDGQHFGSKAEGIVLSRESSGVALAVIDQDDAATPALLCKVELTGSWW